MQEMLAYVAGKIKRNFVVTFLAALAARMLYTAANPVCYFVSVLCMLVSAGMLLVTAVQFISGLVCCFCNVLRRETVMTKRRVKSCVFSRGVCIESVVGKRVLLWHIPFMKSFVEGFCEED